MWLLQNRTPYAAERTWVQDKDANKHWLVAVKATYDVAPNGSLHLADEQLPPCRLGTHFGEPGQSSLQYESDLLGVKPTTDVVVNGSAYAPGGRAAANVDVGIEVGSVRKNLRVSGDRYWVKGVLGDPVISAALPFVKMPIVYERAFGGWDRAPQDPSQHRLDARNPIGTSFLTRANHAVDVPLPNVEYPDQPMRSWQDRPRPAGLGAIEVHWSPRRELAGTYDDRWMKDRFPLWAEDFDPRYHSCAPADQQSDDFLRGGESVRLSNLTPSGYLTFRLPRVYPFFETRFGRERIEHRARLATVIIEPDVPRVMMVWQTSLLCNHGVDYLDVTVVSEKRVI